MLHLPYPKFHSPSTKFDSFLFLRHMIALADEGLIDLVYFIVNTTSCGSGARLRTSILALGSRNDANPLVSISCGLSFTSRHSYFNNIWQSAILISVAAKNRPGQAYFPYPNPRWFWPVVVNGARALSAPSRILKYRYPSKTSGSG